MGPAALSSDQELIPPPYPSSYICIDFKGIPNRLYTLVIYMFISNSTLAHRLLIDYLNQNERLKFSALGGPYLQKQSREMNRCLSSPPEV